MRTILDPGMEIFAGAVPWVLNGQPDGQYHCCVTSPPYWGLRDYGGEPSDWPAVSYAPMAGLPAVDVPAQRCCLGLETTPEAFIGHLVLVFREVRRVLRGDGTLWLNLGDSYADKSLVGIPWRAAMALQADGWYLRSEVVWSKPNPMPESVTDRPTKAHEQVFLLTKSPRYFYDAEAVREPHAAASLDRYKYGLKVKANPLAIKGSLQDRLQAGIGNCERMGDYVNPAGRNLRTVWTIATRPSGVSHFAVMTPELAEHCIKAGTSEHGCCSACGAPWVRVVEREKMVIRRSTRGEEMGEFGQTQSSGTMVSPATLKTTGWRPSCPCEPSAPVPCRVLDPFGGSGTTAAVAAVLGRAGTLCEPNEGYRALMPARAEEVRRSMTKAPAPKVIPGQMSLI